MNRESSQTLNQSQSQKYDRKRKWEDFETHNQDDDDQCNLKKFKKSDDKGFMKMKSPQKKILSQLRRKKKICKVKIRLILKKL